MVTTELLATQNIRNDMLSLQGIDYVEFYVGNPLQAAYFYCTAFGFRMVARAGLETNCRDRVSYVVENNDVRFVLTGALTPNSPVAEHVRLHGDSVKDIAFAVGDAQSSFESAIENGALPLVEPTASEDEDGRIVKATIGIFGDTVHSFVQRHEYEGAFMPRFVECAHAYQPLRQPVSLTEIDHIAFNIEQGKLDQWANFYIEALGCVETHEEMVTTGQSAMNSKVVSDMTNKIKFTIVEPAPAKGKSQIDEYLAFHRGSGVQHIAMASDNIIAAVSALRANGVEFLRTPGTYYNVLQERVGEIDDETLAQLRERCILVDRDEWGSLMQIFTRPVHIRPTVFLEVIQRNGARGFGSGNIKALFEAVEREQAARGNA